MASINPISGSPLPHQPMRESMDQPLIIEPIGAHALTRVDDRHLVNDLGCCDLCCPSKMSCCMSLFCMCGWIGACQQVDLRQELVLLNYGRFLGSLRQPGLYCINPCGSTVHRVSTAVNSTDLPALSVIDLRGNPLRVSAVVNWIVVDAKKAILDVNNYNLFLTNQAEVVMKQICSAHPYDARPGSQEECLKTEAGKIRKDVIALLQERVAQAGLRIMDYQFNEISYAPEIASQMLVRQQAEAMLDARKVVVDGAVSIAHEAIVKLKEVGITMQPAEANALASNLILTICSESRVTPTISLATNTRQQDQQAQHNRNMGLY